MADYKKYQFDNFIISEDSKQKSLNDEDSSFDASFAEETLPQELPDAPEFQEETKQEEIIEETLPQETQDLSEPQETIIPEEEEIVIPQKTYTEEELNELITQAKEDAYAKGVLNSEQNEIAKQNELLESIKAQLTSMFIAITTKEEEQEIDNLRFLAASLRKVFPALEAKQALPEIKKFIEDNFAQITSQKSLAFFFAPDMVKQFTSIIQKVAEHHDYEGKISVHKDDSLSVSDCRIEWKDGYVERNIDKILEKIDDLLINNQQERENG